MILLLGVAVESITLLVSKEVLKPWLRYIPAFSIASENWREIPLNTIWNTDRLRSGHSRKWQTVPLNYTHFCVFVAMVTAEDKMEDGILDYDKHKKLLDFV